MLTVTLTCSSVICPLCNKRTLFQLPERKLSVSVSKNQRSNIMSKQVLLRAKGVDENDKTRQIVIQIDGQTYLVSAYSTCWINQYVD